MNIDLVPLPKMLTIATTSRCNLRCRKCFNHDQDALKKVDMDWDMFESIAKDIFPHISGLSLSVSGEPLLSSHFVQEVELARKYSIPIQITTNATRFKNNAIMELVANSIDMLTVSFDAVTKETYESIRIGSNFDEVLANLRKFKILREKIGKPEKFYFTFVAMKRNLPELPAWIELVHSLGATGASVVPMIKQPGHPPETLSESVENCPDLAQRFVSLAVEKANVLGLNLYYGEMVSLLDKLILASKPGSSLPKLQIVSESANLPKKISMHCHRLYEMAWIGHDGNVMSCCDPNFMIVGNVLTEPFSKIWNNTIFQTIRQQIREGNPPVGCRNCMTLKVLR